MFNLKVFIMNVYLISECCNGLVLVDKGLTVFSSSYAAKLHLRFLVKRLKTIYSNVEFVSVSNRFYNGRFCYILLCYHVVGVSGRPFNYFVDFREEHVF